MHSTFEDELFFLKKMFKELLKKMSRKLTKRVLKVT